MHRFSLILTVFLSACVISILLARPFCPTCGSHHEKMVIANEVNKNDRGQQAVLLKFQIPDKYDLVINDTLVGKKREFYVPVSYFGWYKFSVYDQDRLVHEDWVQVVGDSDQVVVSLPDHLKNDALAAKPNVEHNFGVDTAKLSEPRIYWIGPAFANEPSNPNSLEQWLRERKNKWSVIIITNQAPLLSKSSHDKYRRLASQVNLFVVRPDSWQLQSRNLKPPRVPYTYILSESGSILSELATDNEQEILDRIEYLKNQLPFLRSIRPILWVVVLLIILLGWIIKNSQRG